MAVDLTKKTDAELNQWIANHERIPGGAAKPLYLKLLEERARRSQATQKLNLERSLDHLKASAIGQVCTTYGDLAAASAVDWSQARHQMNGPSGHLDRLLDLCHARGLPMLPAICVNQANVKTGELGDDALAGFVAGARRLGLLVADERDFHRQKRDECWSWGRRQTAQVS